MQNKDLFPRANNKPLEVEVVEINRFGATPAQIQRHPGLFILAVVNRSPDPQASFVVDPAEAGEGHLSPQPLLRIDGQKADPRRHRATTLFLAPAGAFDLKSAATGKILCKLQFN